MPGVQHDLCASTGSWELPTPLPGKAVAAETRLVHEEADTRLSRRTRWRSSQKFGAPNFLCRGRPEAEAYGRGSGLLRRSSFTPSPGGANQVLDLAIDCVERLHGAVVGRAGQVLAADLIERLLRQTRVGNGGRLHHRVRQNAVVEEVSQKSRDLGLRRILRLEPRQK